MNDNKSKTIMAMSSCIVCKKYNAFLDEDRVCERCAKITSRPLRFITRRGLMPILSSGMILPESEWHSLQVQVNKFYTSHDEEWIKNHDEEAKALNKWKLAKANGDMSNVPGFIYFLKASNGCHKIGRAIDVDKRLKGHLRMFPLQIEIVHTVKVQDMVKSETFLLKMFSGEKLQGEWFLLSDEQANWICSLTPELLDAMVQQSA